MSRGVFVSYRRDDASSEAGRLADAIRNHFGRDAVFIDTSDTRVGEEFPEALRRAVENAAVVVAVIGPDWILARDEYGRRRIDDPDDWVRREIRLALERRKTLMPVLVRHARMIPSDALPSDIGALSSRQAFEIRAEKWTHDIELLLREIEPHLGRRSASAVPPESVREDPAPEFTADDLRAVALGFDSSDVAVRNATAEEIREVAAFLDLDEVLAFSRSRKTPERVGAAIALGVHIRSSREARADRRVLSALGELLNDGRSSRVRYRAAEVLLASPAIAQIYEDDLRQLVAADENDYVRDMAARVLRRARR